MSNPGEAIPFRVLIVEDHPMVTEGLSSLLQDYPDLTTVGCAASVADVAAMIEELSPDVAVVDFHLPDGTGADAADHIRTRSPSTAIVFFSVDGSDKRLLAAIEAGASNYLLKSATGKEIVHAIRSAARGETLIPAETVTGVLTRERRSARQHARQAELLDRLTPREQEILALMIQGADNRTIAERLGIGYATVRTHVRSILDKLAAHSQLEAVAKATQWGFRVRRLPWQPRTAPDPTS
jgi:DNA-binding NarL/FixJ family response regulator